jgi:small subunit ribosomal protein S20
MPTHASTAKHMRSDKKKRQRNRMVKSAAKAMEKKVRLTQDKDTALATLAAATSLLDKAAAKNVLHRKTVSRHKSRLAKKVNSLAANSAQKTTGKEK